MKQITITDSLGNKYKLEYNRKSVEILEKQGFSIDKIADKPVTMLPILFHGAFLMHHKKVSTELVEQLLSNIKDKSDLINTLAKMYNEPIEAMLDDPDEESEGNVTWEVSK